MDLIIFTRSDVLAHQKILLNLDFIKRVAINTNEHQWIKSPSKGIYRKFLAREDKECGHATSIVKFEPGSNFSNHDHPLGEKILILEAVFSDELGDCHAVRYFRNRQGFIYSQFSKQVCTLLVKLHQFKKMITNTLMLIQIRHRGYKAVVT
jgi:anti-sigma factor ChrR (cupin superfamily)